MTRSLADKNDSTFDVAIVGGGPGGSAAALSLSSHAPSLSVVMIEASQYDSFRIGETLPPPVRPILEHLGVWDAFCAQGHRQVHGTTAIWGSTIPLDNDFIYMPANTGWHLDRAAFDSMLASQAKERGATLMIGSRLRSAKRIDKEWQLCLSNGTNLFSSFIVDATGGNAAIARQCGARFVEADQLVAIARFFKGKVDDPRTTVEAFEDGWWYTAGLPDGRRIAACMTDADLARSMKLNDVTTWNRKLACMPTISSILRNTEPDGSLVIRSTESRRLEPAAGDHWLAVGDAVSRFDPLSSQGIAKALRSGIFASYVIGDLLLRGDDSSMRRYRHYVSEEFDGYAEVRAKYYREEKRWPTSEFWRRRHRASQSAVEAAHHRLAKTSSVEIFTS